MTLKRQFATGVAWSVLGNGASNVISFVVFALVANLVTPVDLGIAAFAIVLIEVGRLLNGAGLPDLLIQRPEWDDAFASTAFWINLAIGALLALISSLFIAPLLDVTFAPGSGLALTVVSVCFVIDALRSASEAKLRREFNYKGLAARNSLAGIGGGIVGVAMAFTGWGLWALIAQRIVHSTLTTILTWSASGWRPSFVIAVSELGAMLSSGIRLLGASLLANLSMRLPDLMLSFLGPVALAFYRVGARGYEALIQLIMFPFSGAALSGFSRIAARGESLASSYIRTTQFASLLAYPIFFGAGVTAEQFVKLAFGAQWAESSSIMSLLCVIMGPFMLSYMMKSALTALNRSHELILIQGAQAVSVAGAVALGLPFGPLGVAIALVVRAHIALLFNLYLLLRLLDVKPRELLAATLPAYLAAWCMVIVVATADQFVLVSQPDWIKAVAMILAGVIIYPLTLWTFWRPHLQEALYEATTVFPRLERPLKRFIKPRPPRKS